MVTIKGIWDNGGKTVDRYTLLMSNGEAWGFNERPFHPQGFGQYAGNLSKLKTFSHLGKRVSVMSLSLDAQKFVKQIEKSYRENPLIPTQTARSIQTQSYDISRLNPRATRWKLIAGRGSVGDINWGVAGRSLTVLKKELIELNKHIGERVLLTGGGGPGGSIATLKGARIVKEGYMRGKPGLKVFLTGIDPKYGGIGKFGGRESFDPWIDSWQISVKVTANPVLVPAQSSASQIQTQSFDISHMNPRTTKLIDGRRYVYDSFWATGKEAQSRVDRLRAWGLMARADYSRAHRMWTVWSYPHAGTAEGIPTNPVLVPAQSSSAQVQVQSFDISHMNPKLGGWHWRSSDYGEASLHYPSGTLLGRVEKIGPAWVSIVRGSVVGSHGTKIAAKKHIESLQANPNGMTGYTKWGIEYPWHVSDVPYPRDKHGNCTCGCKYCLKMYTHKATRHAHMNMNPKLEAGKWPPYNVNAIAGNVEQVFRSRDIRKLKKPAYNFITLHMGFIAHYSVFGFQDVYRDLEEFAQRLQTSEYSNEYDYNLKQADRHERDPDFDRWYGPVYNKSIAEAMRRIVAVARRYYPGRGTTRMFNPKTLSGAKIRYYGGELWHVYAENIPDQREADRLATAIRRSGYKAKVVAVGRYIPGQGHFRGYDVWESHFPAKRRY